MSNPAHPFDAAIDLQPVEPGRLRGRTRPEWANMVGPFGGITAAVLLHAVEVQPDRLGDPLAFTVNFAAPIVDGDFEVAVKPARTNRTNQHWTMELSQAGDVKTTATAVFAVRRESWADTEPAMPPVADPQTITPMGLAEGIVWPERYDMRFVEGPVPSDGQASSSSTTTMWIRDAAGRQIDYPALSALCDMFYPRVFLRRGGFLPAGTISLTSYFHVDRGQLDGVGADYVLGTAHANRFSAGYFDQSAQVWSRTGHLLATSHQVVYFKG
ncbi:acyl-CoA thioesterase [Mycolicibacter acidiphilus]|uniref:acyl-CoA thioesterase n=1 Tax=Mycolicibacter acidiphilus TaxID=2835306 RepID=UPI003558F6DE